MANTQGIIPATPRPNTDADLARYPIGTMIRHRATGEVYHVAPGRRPDLFPRSIVAVEADGTRWSWGAWWIDSRCEIVGFDPTCGRHPGIYALAVFGFAFTHAGTRDASVALLHRGNTPEEWERLDREVFGV